MNTDLSTVEGVLNAVLSASANRQFQLLGALLILVVVMVVRKLASMKGGKLADIINSDLGGVVLSILTSAAGALYSTLKGGAHLNAAIVLSTLTNAAIASGLFTYGKHTTAKVKAMRDAKKSAAAPTDKPAEPPKVAAFLPFLIISSLMLSSCAHVKSAAINFGKCELGDVPSVVAGIMPDVSTALGGGSPNWESDLDAIGVKAGEDAVACAVAAVLHEVVTAHADVSAVGRLKAERAQIYLNKHRGVSR